MHLVVGATGLVGSEICRLLLNEGKPVRALVRLASDPAKVQSLEALRAEIVRGDLKDAESLRAACRGVTVVLSTASSTLSRQQGDSIESVDRDGQLNLVEAAEAAGVQQFVLVSFPDIPFAFPLQTAKRAVEDRLRRGRMAYTILQPTNFMEVWLGPALGFDVAKGTATIFGKGDAPTSWISLRDVARYAAAAAGNPKANNVTVKLGGPEALSPLDVVRQLKETLGRDMSVQHVPQEALQAQYDGAAEPLQKSFAALSLATTRGDVIDPAHAREVFGTAPSITVREYLAAAVARA